MSVQQFTPLFKKYGDMYNIDSAILESIAMQESSGRPEVIDGTVKGRDGEVGLMQFMEGTAKDYGLTDRTSPEESINAAAKKLADDKQYVLNTYQNIDDFDATKLAIRAYNGGRGNLDNPQTLTYADKVIARLANKYKDPDYINKITANINASFKKEDAAAIQTAQIETKEEKEEEKTAVFSLKEFSNYKEGINPQDLEVDFEKYNKYIATKKEKLKDQPVERNISSTADIQGALFFDKLPPKKATDAKGKIDLKSDKSIKIMLDYLLSRDGKGGYDVIGKSKENITDDFLSKMRKVEWNASRGAVPELLYVANATEADVIKAANAHSLYDRIPSFSDGVAETIVENAWYVFSDPLNYLGLGVGAVVKHKLAAKGIKEALKARVKVVQAKQLAQLKKNKLTGGVKLTEKELNRIEAKSKKVKLSDLRIGKEQFANETIKSKKMAGIVGGSIEGLIGIQHPVTEQLIDQQLTRVSGNLEIKNKFDRGEIKTKEEAIELRDQLIEETKLTSTDIGLAVAFGGLPAFGLGYFSGKALVSGVKDVRKSSDEILRLQLKGISRNIQKEVVQIEATVNKYKGQLSTLIPESTTPKQTSLFEPIKETALIPATSKSDPMDYVFDPKIVGSETAEKANSIKKEINKLEDVLKIKRNVPIFDLDKISKLVHDDFKNQLKEYTDAGLDLNSTDFNNIVLKLNEEAKGTVPFLIKSDKEKGIKLRTKKQIQQAIENGKVSIQNLKDVGIINKQAYENIIFKRSLMTAFDMMASNPDKYKRELLDVVNDDRQISEALAEVLSKAFLDPTNDFVQDLTEVGLKLERGTGKKAAEHVLAYKNLYGSNLRFIRTVKDSIKKNMDLAPEMELLINKKFANIRKEESLTILNRISDRIKKVERESKALVVSGIGTTVRNVMGTATALTMDSATKLFDVATFSSLKIIDGVLQGKYKPGKFTDQLGLDMEAIIENAYINLGAIANSVKSYTPKGQVKIAAEFNLLLQNDSRTKNLLLTSLQEGGEKELSWFSRTMNTFNVAQDAFFRRAIFVNSVRTQLKKSGVDLDTVMAQNKVIDSSVIQQASKDALQGTFAYKPPPGLKDAAGREKRGEQFLEGATGSMVEFFESIPGGSFLLPFPRFMANAIAFQYKYSLFQIPEAASKALAAAKRRGTGIENLKKDLDYNADLMRQVNDPDNKLTKEKANTLYRKFNNGDLKDPKNRDALLTQESLAVDALYNEASERISRSAIGGAMLLTAYYYRKENQDTDWYNLKGLDNSLINMSAVFPIAPFLALADLLVKLNPEPGQEVIVGPEIRRTVDTTVEALAGLKLPSLKPGTPFTDIFQGLTGLTGGNASEKVFKTAGDIIGDFANRFQQPFQIIYGYLDGFAIEYQVGRDQKQTTAEDGMALLYERAYNKISSRASAAIQEGAGNIKDLIIGEDESTAKSIADVIFPTQKAKMPLALSKLRAETPVNGNAFFGQLLGMTAKPSMTYIEREFKRLNINPYPIYGSSGNIKEDREIIQRSILKLMGDEERPGVLATLINSKSYQSLPDSERKLKLKKFFSGTVTSARAEFVENLALTDQEAYAKRFFREKSGQERTVMLNRYINLFGKPPDETDFYLPMIQLYETRFVPFKQAVPALNY